MNERSERGLRGPAVGDQRTSGASAGSMAQAARPQTDESGSREHDQ